ncbi:MAG: Ig-like domain-containing protein [Pirellulaceae bacterium]
MNSAPIANDDTVTLDEDTTVQFSLVAGAGADLDPDGTLNLNSIEILSPPTSGQITEIVNGEVV